MSLQWRPYVGCFRVTEGKRFQDYVVENPSGIHQTRSMLTIFELALLYYLAKDRYTGEGQIVDGGPLLGLTTNVFAKGLSANAAISDKRKRIFSFDLFDRGDMQWWDFGDIPDLTGSIFEHYLQLNRDYLDHIYITPGNLLAHHWNAGPIEILFVDVAKSWELNEFVVDQFFTQLIPGRSYLIQQDYIWYGSYWIHIAMAVLADAFELADVMYGGSAVFRCKRKIAPGQVKDIRSLPIEEKMRLMDLAAAGLPPSAMEVLKCAKASCLLAFGFRSEASQMLEMVDSSVGDSDPVHNFHETIVGNVSLMRSELERSSRV